MSTPKNAITDDPLVPIVVSYERWRSDKGHRVSHRQLVQWDLINEQFKEVKKRLSVRRRIGLAVAVLPMIFPSFLAGFLSWSQWDPISALLAMGVLSWLLIVWAFNGFFSRKLQEKKRLLMRDAWVAERTFHAYKSVRNDAGHLIYSGASSQVKDRVAELSSVAEDRFRELLLVGEDSWLSYVKHTANQQLVMVAAELSHLRSLENQRQQELHRYAVAKPIVEELPLSSGKNIWSAAIEETNVVRGLDKKHN